MWGITRTTSPDAQPSSGDRSEARLLEPVATVVRGVYRLMLAGLIIGAVGPLVGSRLRPFWSSAVVCAESRSDFSADELTTMTQPRAGAGVMVRPTYCSDHPDGVQRLYDLLGDFPSWLLLLGILFLLNRLIQSASRDGVFTAQTVTYLRAAGWWLLLGSLVARAVEAGADAAMLATLAQDYTFDAESWLGAMQAPYTLVFTALGILTFARIMHAGVTMREDLEGTV
ncbi:DUF2975 domain-containing protein [Streptomyces sp. NPDC052052]|uniref:DUF2975 domain-containing protein n=1 Tax=Streptomyces sp. NPDC052052 TaxID=3154756 RepID=UPI00341E67BC